MKSVAHTKYHIIHKPSLFSDFTHIFIKTFRGFFIYFDIVFKMAARATRSSSNVTRENETQIMLPAKKFGAGTIYFPLQ